MVETAYTAERGPELIAVWNAATAGALPLTARLWQQNVAGDPLFRREDCAVAADAAGRAVGFAVTRVLPEAEIAAHPDLARYRGLGHILALAVHPAARGQGHGTRLLTWAEARLRAAGATTALLGGAPGHLVPGPPVAGGSLPFWTRHGYTAPGGVVADLRRDLRDWQPPPPPPAVAAGDYAYRQGAPGEEAAILTFLAATFPGDWHYTLARNFARGYAPGDVTLLVDRAGVIHGFLCAFHPASAILGPSTYWYPALAPGTWGGMGPLGVAPTVRGGGLGLALVAAGTDSLYRRGVRDCAIDWTGLLAFYGRLGFGVWQEYQQLLQKPL